MSRTAAFDRFVEPARIRPAIWRVVLGLVVVGVVMMIWLAAMFGGVWLVGGFPLIDAVMPELVSADTPRGTLMLLGTFVGMVLGTLLAARWLHKRSPATLIGPRRRVLRDFAWGAGAIAAVVIASTLLLGSVGPQPQPNLSFGLWIQLLVPALVLVLIQTGAEEVLFRGYLMQQLAARFRSVIVYLVVPAVLFGVLHYDPVTGGGNAWLIAASATVFGLIAGDLTRVTGNLGAAWGLHFANNVAAILLVGTKGTITGLALYVTPFPADDVATLRPLILLDGAVLIGIWAVLRWRLQR